MFWEIGKKVLCLNGDFTQFKQSQPYIAEQVVYWPGPLQVYTISHIDEDGLGGLLEEIKNPLVKDSEGAEPGYHGWMFCRFITLDNAPFSDVTEQSLQSRKGIAYLYDRITYHSRYDEAWQFELCHWNILLQIMRDQPETRRLAERLEKHHQDMQKKERQNAVAQLAIGQAITGKHLVFGRGMVSEPPIEAPFRIIDDVPVYHVSKNTPPSFSGDAIDETKDGSPHNLGFFYHAYLLIGMPDVGGKIHFSVTEDLKDYYVLWIRTKLDEWAFGKTEPSEHEILAWTPKQKKDTIRKAAARMLRAYFLDYANEEESIYADMDYDSYGSRFVDFCAGAVMHTRHASEEEFNAVLTKCPAYLREHYLHQAIIEPEA